MMDAQLTSALGPALTQALADKGFAELTAVQQAVLDPALAGRDLRITSQTGSGKTLAIGFALRALATDPCVTELKVARPKALVVAPTRELAQQVDAELRWLYSHLAGRVVSVTGGSSLRDERRELARGPAIIVGTPGRLLDHLRRSAIDPSAVSAVVLDEADRMLELGFREELDAILEMVPEGRATHLVSATFPRAVRALADSVQREPAHVEGTRLGVANADIDHVVHLIDPRQKVDAIVNLLLRHPGEQTLVFARTRADVADIASALSGAGFAASSLSGEMDQAARNRALAAFKRGTLKVLVATDVAARGIDVQDITRVIHAELPTHADSYTHRSGRTGRAGRKGTSSLLVAPASVVHATRILRTAGVAHRFEPIPTPAEIRHAADERVIAELTQPDAPGDDAEASLDATQERLQSLAERLVQAGDPVRTVARLLAQTSYANSAEARDVRAVSAPRDRGRGAFERGKFDRGPRREAHERFDAPRHGRGLEPAAGRRNDAAAARARQPAAGKLGLARGPARDTALRETAPRDTALRDTSARARGAAGSTGSRERAPARSWVSFRVTWGEQNGADARRLLAMVCRRGDIRGKDVGAIRVERNFSIVDVAQDVATTFEQAAGQPDPREPRVAISRDGHGGARSASRGGGDAGPARVMGGSSFPKRGGRPKPAPFKPRRRG